MPCITTKIVSEFINSNKEKPLILEIEPPCDVVSEKRLKFYEKLGFKLNNYEYYQPPLRENSKPYKLNIMSYPKKLNQKEFDEAKSVIHSKVYNCRV